MSDGHRSKISPITWALLLVPPLLALGIQWIDGDFYLRWNGLIYLKIAAWLAAGTCVLWAFLSLIFAKNPFDLLRKSGGMNIFLALGLTMVVFTLHRFYPGKFKVLRLLLLMAVLLQWLRAFRLAVIHSQIKALWKNLATSLMGVVTLLLIAEMAFVFVAKSHGSYHEGFAAINWARRYFRENQVGNIYNRGENCSAKAGDLLFIGDSFTAGYGIKNEKDRFSDLLAAKAGLQDRFCNWAELGAGLDDEWEVLEENTGDIKDLTVVLGYVLNDIEPIASRHLHQYPWTPPSRRASTLIWPVIDHSHFFNFIFAETAFSGKEMPFNAFMDQVFQDSVVVKEHQWEIEEFMEFCQEREMKVIVVVFPLFQDLAGSARYEAQIAGFFESAGAQTLRVSEVVADLDPADLVVNRVDPHPGPKVHARIAQALFERFFKGKNDSGYAK